MAGVTVDSVIVSLEARVQKYQTDLAAATKQTEDAFKRMRRAAAKPITPKVGEAQTVTQDATKVEQAEGRKQRAKKKTAETEAQAQARIQAVIARTIARQNEQAANAERNSVRIQRAYNRSLASAQTRAMSGTSLGSGTQAAPRQASDPIDYSLRDRIDAETRLAAIRGTNDTKAKNALQDQITYLRLIERYKKAGLNDTQAATRAEQRLAEIERARARQAARQPAARAAGGGVGLRGLGPAIGIGTAVVAAKQFLEIADASKNLEAQLRLATQGFGSFGQAQEDVRRISTTTRSDVEATAKLYANFTRNAKELGITQEEAARATETVAKAFAISGASTVEASQATRQLVQGLQSGTLRGEELNSVLEQAPRLSTLIAQSLGVTVGELRSLAAEGKLTSKALVDAFTNAKFTKGLDAEFQQLPVTFEQAMTLVSNAAIETFGAFDRGGQFSKSIAEFVSDSAGGFGSMAEAAERLGITVRSEFSGIATVIGTVAGAIQGLIGFFQSVDNALANIPSRLGEILNRLNPIQDMIQRIRNSPEYQRAANSTRTRLEGEAAENRFRASKFISGTDIFGNPNVGTPGGGRPAGAVIGENAADKRKREAAARKAEAAARKAQREADKAEREQLRDEQQERQAQIEVLRARAALTDNVQERADFELQTLAIEKAQRVSDIQSDKTLSEMEKKARLKLIETLYGPVNSDPNSISVGAGGLLQRGVNRESQREIERDAADIADRLASIQQDRLQDELDAAVTRGERQRIQLELLDLELAERRRALELQRSTARSDEERNAIQSQIDALPGSRERGADAIARDNEGPLARYRRGLNNTEDLIENAVVDQLQQVEDGITSAISSQLGVKNPILDAIIRQFIQQQLIAPLVAGFGGGTGGGGIGGILGSIGSLFAGARASGGNVSAGQLYKVNERGVEGFRPAQSGTIIPLGRMNTTSRGGAPTIIAPQSFDLRGVMMTADVLRQLEARNRQYANAVGAAATKSAVEATPGYLANQRRYGQ